MINEEYLKTLSDEALRLIIKTQNAQLIELDNELKKYETTTKIKLAEEIATLKEMVKKGLKKAKSIDARKLPITNKSVIDLLIYIDAALDDLGSEK